MCVRICICVGRINVSVIFQKYKNYNYMCKTMLSLLTVTVQSGPTFPPPGWYFMLSVDPILERTFFRSGVGALIGLGFRGARGTGGFFSTGVCLGTGGLVMTRRRWEFSPLVEATGVADVAEGAVRRAAEREESFIANTGVLLIPSSEELNITLHLFPN